MNLRTIAARTAVASATTALAAVGLVGVSTTAANAATASSDYQCTSPLGDLGTFKVSIEVPLLPPTAPAGYPIDQGLLSYTGTVVVPAQTAALLGQAGVDGGKADDFAFAIGSALDAKAPGTYTKGDANPDGSVNFTGSGANDAFTLPKAGTYAVTMPESFTFTPTSGGNPLPVTASCTTTAPGKLGDVQLDKQTGTLTAKAAKTAKGYKLTAVAGNEYGTPTGKVTAKLGTKKYTGTLKKGKAVIALPKSAKGKTVTVSYKGDGYTKAPAPVKVKIK